MILKKIRTIVLLSTLSALVFLISGCGQGDSPKLVSKQFWEAVMTRDMETAKQLSTWDTVSYLRYLKGDKLHPERFELKEEMIGDTRAEISTVLFTSRPGKSGVKVPGVTVLVKIDQGWRVDVKKTLGSVVTNTVDTVFEELNGLMQQGLNELDKSLSESMHEIGKAFEESAKEFKNELHKELSKPLFPKPPKTNKLNNHSGRPI